LAFDPLLLPHYDIVFCIAAMNLPRSGLLKGSKMYLVAIAWMYVVLMAAVVEATSSNGTVLGAAFTFLLWGVLPLTIVMYLLRAPTRRRERRAREAASAALDPDRGGHAPGDAVAPEREEP
jgi:predicted membrane channel-forming protein YqfA (hemolysin III family)